MNPKGLERPPDTSSSPPEHVLDRLLLAVSVSLLLGWALAPRIVLHAADTEPLFWTTERLEPIEKGGGIAYRGSTQSGGSHRTVLEDGAALDRRPAAQVRAQQGSFYFRGDFVLFSSTDGTDPRSNGRRYEVRSPRALDHRTLSVLLGLFVGVHLAVALWLLRRLVSRTASRAIVGVLLAAVAFVLTGGLLERLPLSSGSDLLGERLDQLRPSVDEIQTLFLGSSRIYRHLDPSVFDTTFAEHGLDMRSFNVGVPGMRTLEALTTMRWLFDRHPGRLRWLVVDADAEGLPLFIGDDNLLSERVVRWHGLRNLPVILAAVAATDEPGSRRILTAAGHLQATAFRIGRVGRGLGWIDALVGRTPPEVPIENRGYLSLEEELRSASTPARRAAVEDRWNQLHDRPQNYRRIMARLARSSPNGELTDALDLELLGALQSEADNHGIEVLFVIDARPNRRPTLVYAFESGVVERLLRFDDPDAFPELYDPDNRFDIHHLDRASARDYTRRIAAHLLELEAEMDAGSPP